MMDDADLLKKYIEQDTATIKSIQSWMHTQREVLRILKMVEGKERGDQPVLQSAAMYDGENHISVLALLNKPQFKQQLIEILKEGLRHEWEDSVAKIKELKEKLK